MPGRAEALALVEVDRDGVRAAHLEREARVRVADLRVQLGEQRRGEALALVIEVDGDVHHVPDGVVARADQVADQRCSLAHGAARQMPDCLDSSSTNIASDHGVGNTRRSIAITCGRSG